MKQWKKHLLDFFIPGHCPICDRVLPYLELQLSFDRPGPIFSGKIAFSREDICPKCRSLLPYIRGPICMKCGKALEKEEKEYCADCRRNRHSFDRGIAVYTYKGRLRQSLQRIKFSSRREYLDFYGKELITTAEKWIFRWQPDFLIPVPMYWENERKRGFNQAQVLALQLAEAYRIPVCTDRIKKIRRTDDQKKLDRKARRKNLHQAFALTGSLPAGQTALIVDDIYTTGSTLDELALLLKAHGIRRVYFLVLAAGSDQWSDV